MVRWWVLNAPLVGTEVSLTFYRRDVSTEQRTEVWLVVRHVRSGYFGCSLGTKKQK
jgi:hypothetical protein